MYHLVKDNKAIRHYKSFVGKISMPPDSARTGGMQ